MTNNITTEAINYQLKAMNCELYRIGIYNREKNYMLNLDSLTEGSINKKIKYLKFQNANGHDIFISPSKETERAIILVDDLTNNNIVNMKNDGYNPACIIETSPNNYQVWISLGQNPLSSEYRKIVSKFLASEYNGDIGSVGSNHYGRLAGFTNRKSKYLTYFGYPYVLCTEYTGEHAHNRHKLIQYAENEFNHTINKQNKEIKTSMNNKQLCSEKAYELYFNQWEKHIKMYGKSYDLSRGDFAVVCRMIKEGYNRDEIFNAILLCSPNIKSRKGNYTEDYANRTINAAMQRL
ncbi:MAG: RepB family DNA primase [Bacteroidales bacterium]|jgi:hypothetical protein|nr:RepB family DNA primase [Bacteroidales bacterium]